MDLTKRQRMLSAVFLVGLVGLVVDRTILRPQGGPQAASASPAREPPAALPAAVPEAEKTAGPVSVADRLNRLAAGTRGSADEVRDPFVLPFSWSDSTGAGGERLPDSVLAFVQKHRLRAVVMQEGRHCALLDESDRFLAPGDVLDGFRLVAVTPGSAVFESQGKRATLDLLVK